MAERPGRIVLVGFMGSGKTSVGRVLARKLRYRFEDMDERIEQRTGRTVARIFREDGEEAFRELEREEALALSSLPRRVVATGGGAFTRLATRQLLQQGALTVWLRCDLRADPGANPGRRLPPLAATVPYAGLAGRARTLATDWLHVGRRRFGGNASRGGRPGREHAQGRKRMRSSARQ